MRNISPKQEEYLRTNYKYCPLSGSIVGVKGERLTAKTPKGYYKVRYSVNGRKYFDVTQHRLAFFLMTGRWPTMIDHRNRIRTDNRWYNLRECTASENSRNSNRSIGRQVGVRPAKASGKWRVDISVDSRNLTIGTFNSYEEAVAARLAAEVKYYGKYL